MFEQNHRLISCGINIDDNVMLIDNKVHKLFLVFDTIQFLCNFSLLLEYLSMPEVTTSSVLAIDGGKKKSFKIIQHPSSIKCRRKGERKPKNI